MLFGAAVALAAQLGMGSASGGRRSPTPASSRPCWPPTALRPTARVHSGLLRAAVLHRARGAGTCWSRFWLALHDAWARVLDEPLADRRCWFAHYWSRSRRGILVARPLARRRPLAPKRAPPSDARGCAGSSALAFVLGFGFLTIGGIERSYGFGAAGRAVGVRARAARRLASSGRCAILHEMRGLS